MTFWYLATPYSKFPGGLDAAFDLACREAARLIRAGVPVFSPIAHTHPIARAAQMDPLARAAQMDPLDHGVWLPANKPMMDAASGLIMLLAESRRQSYGMRVELDTFRAAGKPVIWMAPGVVPDELLR